MVVYVHDPSTEGHPLLHVRSHPVLAITNLLCGIFLLNLGIWGLGRWPNGQVLAVSVGTLMNSDPQHHVNTRHYSRVCL